MKLRLQKNSIRLRLSSNEVSELRESEVISEQIQFNQSRLLIYTLKISNETKDISVDFTNKEITIKIPFDTAHNWIKTNLIGLEYEQIIDQNLTLKVLIEKDFAR